VRQRGEHLGRLVVVGRTNAAKPLPVRQASRMSAGLVVRELDSAGQFHRYGQFEPIPAPVVED